MPAYDLDLVFDCHDPHLVASFWLTALEGYDFPGSDPDGPPGAAPAGFDTWEAWADSMGFPAEGRNLARTIIDLSDRGRPDIFFLAVPEGKAGKNRLHLDIKVSKGLPAESVRERQDTEAARLVAAGATVQSRVDEGDGSHLILQDPEGNEFCVI